MISVKIIMYKGKKDLNVKNVWIVIPDKLTISTVISVSSATKDIKINMFFAKNANDVLNLHNTTCTFLMIKFAIEIK